jgi:hypothetical protein
LRAFAIAAFSAFASATGDEDALDALAVVMFSIAAIWLALSELLLPAAYSSSAPSFFAWPSRLLHLHEERVRDVLRDQADLDRLSLGGGLAEAAATRRPNATTARKATARLSGAARRRGGSVR